MTMVIIGFVVSGLFVFSLFLLNFDKHWFGSSNVYFIAWKSFNMKISFWWLLLFSIWFVILWLTLVFLGWPKMLSIYFNYYTKYFLFLCSLRFFDSLKNERKSAYLFQKAHTSKWVACVFVCSVFYFVFVNLCLISFSYKNYTERSFIRIVRMSFNMTF